MESPNDLLYRTHGEIAIDCDTQRLGRIHGKAIFRKCN